VHCWTAYFRGTVIWLALIDDVDREQLERLVTGNSERTMRHVANIDFG
jgi:hypothetical protein